MITISKSGMSPILIEEVFVDEPKGKKLRDNPGGENELELSY